MNFETKTEQVKSSTQGKEALTSGDQITLQNDTTLSIIACVSNNFLGVRSVGYVLPGNTVKLPSGPAWWDVYLLVETTAAVILTFNGLSWDVVFNYKKSDVNSLANLKVSDFQK
jgi:hypothetical protein